MGSTEIEKLCASVSLKEREGPVPKLHANLKEEEAQKMALCLACKILLTDLIYNLPLLCMTKDIARFLGSIIGEVKEVDTGPYGDCLGKFLRVRVSVEVDKPLRRVIWVDVLGDEEETIMPVHYE
ncbi:hypothetical protein Ddye_021074 [Dipteronia dyeriana]|uniref:Uncharacterized protein n=1 Tax=Dipteronia dyeriana TaxID=168575 RepID=A0AAD9U0Y0_9ROSI|nr:hypothetical protein Ddye_021074 [Dipteronia dyeriana]